MVTFKTLTPILVKAVSKAFSSEGILNEVKQTSKSVQTRLSELDVVRVGLYDLNWCKALRLVKSSGAQLT